MDGVKLVFVGNLSPKITAEEITELFRSFHVQIVDGEGAVDIKTGFVFVKVVDEDGLEDKISSMHKSSIPTYPGIPITVQFAKTDPDELKRRLEKRKSSANPSSCLFVVGYDPSTTKPHYLEYEFEKVAKVKRVEMMKNFSYVYFNTIIDAKRVLEHFNGQELFGKKLSVEYRVASGSDNRRSRPRSSERHDRRGRDDSRGRPREPEVYERRPERPRSRSRDRDREERRMYVEYIVPYPADIHPPYVSSKFVGDYSPRSMPMAFRVPDMNILASGGPMDHEYERDKYRVTYDAYDRGSRYDSFPSTRRDSPPYERARPTRSRSRDRGYGTNAEPTVMYNQRPTNRQYPNRDRSKDESESVDIRGADPQPLSISRREPLDSLRGTSSRSPSPDDY